MGTFDLRRTIVELCDRVDQAAVVAGEDSGQLLHAVALHCRARRYGSNRVSESAKQVAPMASIAVDVVEKHFGIDRKLILGRRRPHNVCLARNAAFRILRDHTDATLSAVGHAFYRDFGTVLHGVNSVSKRIDTEPITRTMYEAAEKEFLERVKGEVGK